MKANSLNRCTARGCPPLRHGAIARERIIKDVITLSAGRWKERNRDRRQDVGSIKRSRPWEVAPLYAGGQAACLKMCILWSKLTAPTARGLPPPVLALGNQAFRRFLKIWNSYC